MAENLIAKLDRLGAGAGIKQMTPELYSFALDVRKDLMDGWPKRPWVGLTGEDFSAIKFPVEMRFPAEFRAGARWADTKLKEKNNG